jgi:hypothetical protein
MAFFAVMRDSAGLAVYLSLAAVYMFYLGLKHYDKDMKP